jgi:hypothetical protein
MAQWWRDHPGDMKYEHKFRKARKTERRAARAKKTLDQL